MLASGTTQVCLCDFLKRYVWEEAQAFVSRFVQVQPITVQRWQAATNVPRGKELLSLRVLLDLAGYKVEGFSELPRPTKQFARLIALGALSVEEAQDLFGYSSSQGVYVLLLKGGGIQRQKEYRLVRFVEESHDELKQLVTVFKESLSQLTLIDLPLPEVSAPSSQLAAAGTQKAVPGGQEKPQLSDATPAQDTQFDQDTLALALVDTVRLVNHLYDTLGTNSDKRQLRLNVRFALGEQTIDHAILALEELKSP